jgi:hypothetical protein
MFYIFGYLLFIIALAACGYKKVAKTLIFLPFALLASFAMFGPIGAVLVIPILALVAYARSTNFPIIRRIAPAQANPAQCDPA